MNVQAAIEDLRSNPWNEERLRLTALELGAALPRLGDGDLVELNRELSRLNGTSPEEAPERLKGLYSALQCVMSGALQQRRQDRERQARDEEWDRALKPDWQRLLLAARKQEPFRPGMLPTADLEMQEPQISDNLEGMVDAGLLEQVRPQGGGPLIYYLTYEGKRQAERLERQSVKTKESSAELSGLSPPPPPPPPVVGAPPLRGSRGRPGQVNRGEEPVTIITKKPGPKHAGDRAHYKERD